MASTAAEGLGRYEIVEELGRGAMGVVYLAQDPTLGRLVALKELTGPGGGSGPEAAAALREARAGGGLQHPNIVTVHDADDGERPFIAMEYVRGTDLKELLRAGQPLPVDFVLSAVTQVAAALDHAHAHGVVHRDVKPGNILITTEETVKLTDFGIASTRLQGPPSERFGTPHYVAPEQLRGEPVDARGDIFALAVVTYEMLTGRRPFDHPELEEVVRRLAEEPFTPPTEHGVELPREVIEALERALAKQPAGRFESAGAFAHALRAAFERRREAATRDLSDLLPPAPPRRRRRPLVWAALALAALLAAAGGWSLTRSAPASAPALALREPHRVVGSPAELVREAESLLAAGDAIGAEQAIELARRMAPHRPELDRLATRVATRAEAQRQARQRDGAVERLLAEALELRAAGRYSRALASLRQAAELAPEEPAITQLLRSTAAARARHLSSQRSQSAEVVQVAPTAPRPAAAPLQEAIQPAADWSDLRIDLFSRAPRGIVTLYAGDEQVLREPFRFGRRSGLLRRQAGAGRLEARLRLPAGATDLRVYVTLPGRAAEAWQETVELPAGATSVLRILVDSGGELTIQLD